MPTPTDSDIPALLASINKHELPKAYGNHAAAWRSLRCTAPTLLAPIARRELNKAYGSHAPAWRPLTRRTDSTIGRKRRARRARGRRIEARQRMPQRMTVAQWSPDKITSLTCWHSQDHPLVQDGRVVGLRDLSGHGRHFVFDPGGKKADD